jgi:hypothetical protein
MIVKNLMRMALGQISGELGAAMDGETKCRPTPYQATREINYKTNMVPICKFDLHILSNCPHASQKALCSKRLRTDLRLIESEFEGAVVRMRKGTNSRELRLPECKRHALSDMLNVRMGAIKHIGTTPRHN